MTQLTVDPDITRAATLPAYFYTSPEWFEQTKEKIFPTTWQFCLSTESLSLEGQVVPHTLLPGFLDEPIMFIRDLKAQLYCLSNVCTHRANLMVEAPCLAKQLKCRYHGRRFKLNGEFVHMPAFEQAQNFPTERDNLPRIPMGQLGKFLFAALLPRIPFEETFAPIQSRLHWFPFNDLRLDLNRSRDYLVKAHWALYCENYLEGLHIPFVHPALRMAIEFQTYTTEIYPYANLQLALANKSDAAFNIPRGAQDFGKPVAAFYYWIFPNTMLNFYPWGCSVNIVKPLNPELTKVSFLTFVADETKLNMGAGAELDMVEREDESVVESVQKGIRSRFYKAGRYSPALEQGTHHFHQLLCQFLNSPGCSHAWKGTLKEH